MTRSRILKRILKDLSIEHIVWNSFDVIGEIAILRAGYNEEKINDNLETLKIVGKKLLDELGYIKAVFLAYSPIQGEHRTRKLLHLAGKKETTTIYVEHGSKFLVDIEKTYISPRLSFEHLRIAKLVNKNEVVTNMFAGVGLFSIIIAKKSEPKKVYSIDINPTAFQLMLKNIRLNKVEDKVIPYLGDARKVIKEELVGKANRVLMPLPNFDKSFYEAAILALKNQTGYIHSYEFVRYTGKKKQESIEIAFRKVRTLIDTNRHKIELVGGRIVRMVGPRFYQVVMDLEIT